MPGEPTQENQQIDRPTALLNSVIYDQNMVRSLLTKSDEKQRIIQSISSQVEELDPAETAGLFKNVLVGLGSDDKVWTTDRRDAALEILGVIPLDKISQDELLSLYTRAIYTQSIISELYGSIFSLLEAGKIIAPALKKELYTEVALTNAWERVSEYFIGNDSVFIQQTAKEVVQLISPPIIEAVQPDGQSEKLGWRDKPQLERGERILHDEYLKVVQERGSFKLTLWNNVPEFRSLCERLGIKLERFWNIHDPDQTAAALGKILQEQAPLVLTTLDRTLRQKTGLGLDEMIPEKAKVIADEIVQAAEEARELIRGSISDFNSITDRFKNLIEVARTRSPQAQRSMLQPVANFFRENGLNLSKSNIEELTRIFADDKLMAQVKGEFERKQEEKKGAVAKLEAAFSLNGSEVKPSLISRTRDDLFLGDLTGDCTAYHLNVGMNAWTVPIWLTNPGFIMFKIPDGDQLTAKVGILLAIADGKPSLVIDSIETRKGIKDEEAAKERIKAGLKFLQEWATGIGIPQIFIANITNSSDLLPILESVSEQSQVGDFHALGGLGGVAELRKNLIGINDVKERIYLQSVEDEHDLPLETGSLIYDFEKEMNELLEKTPQKAIVEELLRNAEWDQVFGYIMDIKFPNLSKVDRKWERFKELMDQHLVIDQGRHVSNPGEEEILTRTSLPQTLRSIYSQVDPGHDYLDPDSPKDMMILDKVDDEFYVMSSFLKLLKELEAWGLTPTDALKKLYGSSTAVEGPAGLELNLYKKSPRLVIS